MPGDAKENCEDGWNESADDIVSSGDRDFGFCRIHRR